MILQFCSFSLLLTLVSGHIRLTWPPARPLALDFLDNGRTKGPCGMEKSGDKETDLLAGSRMNISWFMAYPHKGGFQIELMDQNEEVIANLSPGDGFYGDADPTQQEYAVTLPNTECTGCTLRLQRQASEWGKLYKFWSCSDVNIVKDSKNAVICQNNGKLRGSKCECPKLFSGDYCQFADMCWDNADCNNNGECHSISEVSYPKKICMCKPGFFGFSCEKESSLKEASYDASKYQTIKLGVKNQLLWREVQDEMEFVIVDHSGETWAAVGWRPQGVDASCKNFPNEQQLQDLPVNPEVETEPGPAGASEPESGAEKTASGEPEPQPKSAEDFAAVLDSQSETQPFYVAQKDEQGQFFQFSDFNPFADANIKDGSADPWYLAKTYQKREGDSNAEPNPLGEAVAAEPHSEPTFATVKDSKTKSEPAPNGESGSEPEPKSEGEPYAEPAGEPEPGNAAVIAAEPSGEPQSEPEPEPGSAGKSSSSLHPMDCQDIVAGCVVDGPLFAIWDMYTRDRSTPIPDFAYGGEDSLTAATGWKEGGKSIMMFRRKIKASEKSDHNLEGDMHVIWAKGQAAGNYFHYPKSGIEHETATRTKDYYEPHMLRYHGTGKDDRGSVRASFGGSTAAVIAETLSTKQAPSDCIGAYSSEDYALEWDAKAEPGMIKFTLIIDQIVPNFWYGVGVSANLLMSDTDVYLVEPDDDKYNVLDRYATGYRSPGLDAEQNLKSISVEQKDGQLRASFSRHLSTEDGVEDVDMKSQCVYLVFPTSGGRISQLDSSIGKHLFTPEFSEKLCFQKCSSEPTAEIAAEPEAAVEPEPEPKAEAEPEPEPTKSEAGSDSKKNYVCERQSNVDECAGNLQQKWVTRWYRVPGTNECNVYINSVCTEAHNIMTLPTEQQCYQACFTDEEKSILPVFKDIEFVHGYLILKRS